MSQRRVENTRVHFWTFSPVSVKVSVVVEKFSMKLNNSIVIEGLQNHLNEKFRKFRNPSEDFSMFTKIDSVELVDKFEFIALVYSRLSSSPSCFSHIQF